MEKKKKTKEWAAIVINETRYEKVCENNQKEERENF